MAGVRANIHGHIHTHDFHSGLTPGARTQPTLVTLNLNIIGDHPGSSLNLDITGSHSGQGVTMMFSHFAWEHVAELQV